MDNYPKKEPALYYKDTLVNMLNACIRHEKHIPKFFEMNITKEALEEVKENMEKTIKHTEKMFNDNPNGDFPKFLKRQYLENIQKVVFIEEKLSKISN